MNNFKEKIKDIDYALVEEKRPPIYTCMKYWGKKPHNIWFEYIKNYTSSSGCYMDPFTGSAMSAFEAVRAGRKAIALDLNPLSSFIIETVCSDFDEKLFCKYANQVINNVMNSIEYHHLFMYKEKYRNYVVHNVKWNLDKIYEVCLESLDQSSRICLDPSEDDYFAVEHSEKINNQYKYPNKKFRESISFSNSFLNNIGNTYDKLWTKRNLFILAYIFDEIISLKDKKIINQLLFAFIQTVHLSSKMCVPRSKKTNRDFSTSWGRSAFLFSKKQMEMNPLLIFKSNCFEKQSALKCLEYASHYFNKKPIIRNIYDEKVDITKNVDIWYGVCDVKKIKNILPEKCIDFILTDPPYGGLVQYLDLSSIWLSWLELYDDKYSPKYEDEITVNSVKNYSDFESDFTEALQNINYVLKEDSCLVLTFHNKDLNTWQSFLKSIENSGFQIEKVIHQQNKRTGESNVSDPFGTSASDFYIRCKKVDVKYLKKVSKQEIEDIIVTEVKKIILSRFEPTPYQILFNGLLAELSMLNIDIKNFDTPLLECLKKHLGKEFVMQENISNKAGNYWWIKDVKFNESSPKRLSNQVRLLVKKMFENKEKISYEKIFAKIFRNFQNGRTPDMLTIEEIVSEFATKKNDTWFRR